MGKYKLMNWQTLPFKKRSFEGQMDRYIKCCVVSNDNPEKVLDVICLFGFGWSLMDIVRNYELGIDKEKCKEVLEHPINGEFVAVKSLHGPLYHRYTRDEGLYGLCAPQNVGKAERDANGKVKIYHSIIVFTHYYDNDGEKEYVNGWFPEQMYRRYVGYRYLPLSDLTEPLKLEG